jgi:hypothetical protein
MTVIPFGDTRCPNWIRKKPKKLGLVCQVY